MKFQVTERISTTTSHVEIMNALEEQMEKVSTNLNRNGDKITTESIALAMLHFIFRKDTSTIKADQVDDGFLLVADVHYCPPFLFYIYIAIVLLPFVVSIMSPSFSLINITYFIFVIISIAIYRNQKKTLSDAIENVFKKNK